MRRRAEPCVNGARFLPKDASGKSVPLFSYNGTTYAPVRAICEAVDIPVVAIGGINAGNLPQLAGSGVDGVAVVSAIFAQPDPGAATRHLLELAGTMVASHG